MTFEDNNYSRKHSFIIRKQNNWLNDKGRKVKLKQYIELVLYYYYENRKKKRAMS